MIFLLDANVPIAARTNPTIVECQKQSTFRGIGWMLYDCDGMTLSTAPILFTLGYQQRSLDEFIALLLEASIDVLVDVRETAWSHKPGFSKTGLKRALGDHEIAYVHAKFAGNPKHLRTSAASHRQCLQLYARHIEDNTGIIETFDELIGRLLDAGKRVCVTCYERHPDDCHRGLLADRWQEGTYRDVHHLGADNSCRIRQD